MIGKPTLAGVAGLGLEPIDEIDDIVEPATSARSDAASSDGDCKMCLAGSGPAVGANPAQGNERRDAQRGSAKEYSALGKILAG